MRFYQGLLPAIIWDPKRGRPLVEFQQGVFETDDEDIIRRLYKDGYLVEDDVATLQAGGNLTHGGFEPQIPVDKDLPSGRPPMDNPEIAGGEPHKRKVESSESDQGKKSKTIGLAEKPSADAKRTRKKSTSKKATTKKKITRKKSTSKKKATKKKSTSKKRTIKRREE